MSTLLVSATLLEIKPILVEWEMYSDEACEPLFIDGNNTDVLITGVGAQAMIYHLTKALQQKKYKHCCLIGIAGAYNKEIELGTLLEVTKSSFYDLGAENSESFVDVFDMELIPFDQYPFNDKIISNPQTNYWGLDRSIALSKNTVTGIEHDYISKLKTTTNYIESMEGASFFYTCMLENVSFSEIRSISNYIEVRDKEKWNITLAIKNLNSFILSKFKK